MDKKPLSPNSQYADGSKVPSISVSASQDPSPDSKKKRERSPLRIPSSSMMSISHHVVVPRDGAIGFSCSGIGDPVDFDVVARHKRITTANTTGTKPEIKKPEIEKPEIEKPEIETEEENDKSPTCTKPERKDGVDYYGSLENTIAASIKSVESSPSKEFWEETGALPKYLKKDSTKTPPKILPPFRKQTPTKPKINIELFPDIPDPIEKSDEQKSEEQPKTLSSSPVGKSVERKFEELPVSAPSSSTEAILSSSSIETINSSELSSTSKAFWEGTGAIPKYLKKDSVRTPPKVLPPFLKQIPTKDKIQIELFPDVPDAVRKSEHKSVEPTKTSPSSPVVKSNEQKSEEPSGNKPSSSVWKSEESVKSIPLTSTETMSPSCSTETKSPLRNLPKSRSDFKDNIEWVKFNCLDFQDYKRTVNNKQKGVENSLNQLLPVMESSKKDVLNLATKLTKVRSELCTTEEALRIQNDKLKYLVGRTMATVSKIDDVLERFRADILAYTTLSTEGNEGIDMRLSRLLMVLCGLSDRESSWDRNSLIREAFSEDETEVTQSDSST